MVGYFHAVPVINDWQSFDQRLCEIESQWETNPANGGINSAGKWKCLERLAMLVKGSLVPETARRTFALPVASNRAQQLFPPNAH